MAHNYRQDALLDGVVAFLHGKTFDSRLSLPTPLPRTCLSLCDVEACQAQNSQLLTPICSSVVCYLKLDPSIPRFASAAALPLFRFENWVPIGEKREKDSCPLLAVGCDARSMSAL